MHVYRFRMSNGMLVTSYGRTAAEALRKVTTAGFTVRTAPVR